MGFKYFIVKRISGGRHRWRTLPVLCSGKPGGLEIVVVFGFGCGFEFRSRTHCGVGGLFDELDKSMLCLLNQWVVEQSCMHLSRTAKDDALRST